MTVTSSSRSSGPPEGRGALRLESGHSVPLREQVATSLRHALVVGDLEPGEILTAPVLASEFGVSATPVREAMLDLATEGHVAPIRYKGYRVVEISAATRANILQLRALIEIPLMAQVARDGVPSEVLDHANDVAERSVEAARRGDLVDFIRLDMDLHVRLLETTGNSVAVRHVRSLRYMSRLTGLRDLVDSGELTHTAQEHLQIVAAIRERDPRTTERLMTRHLGHVSGVWSGATED
ncbi:MULTISPECIES: GntR family transcriptional regulator [Kocuria]|uniref:GntR family transcriptional regulator n=1 Tax=Kocuria TaxID=57493 RepID=UPI0028AEF580|nr:MULTISPECIES: GntR family transcriptional regulator [Kocuria]MCT2360569.1 GntR family transcriptional regulator [Kocuria marina]